LPTVGHYCVHRGRGGGKGQRKGFTETDYTRRLNAAHQQRGGPLLVDWDNLKCATRRYGIGWGEELHRREVAPAW
jgi:hypothetical protein